MKRALITGIAGQDSSYLAELLLTNGYEVWGFLRRTTNTQRINHILPLLHLVYGNVADQESIVLVIQKSEPDEIYNLASQSHLLASFETPAYTSDVTALGPTRMLEIVHTKYPKIRFFQASSSELYGRVLETPQTERTPIYPCSPYAVAKAYAFFATRNFREAYGVFAVNGILYNHNSPRRSEEFATRKITRAATRIKLGLQDKLKLGNIDSKRDFGFAGDYVEAMWRMLQAEVPDDYIIATGELHTIREFAERAFDLLSLDWQEYVEYDPELSRSSEVDLLCGDASKAQRELGWKPKVSFDELIRMMVEADLELAHAEAKR